MNTDTVFSPQNPRQADIMEYDQFSDRELAEREWLETPCDTQGAPPPGWRQCAQCGAVLPLARFIFRGERKEMCPACRKVINNRMAQRRFYKKNKLARLTAEAKLREPIEDAAEALRKASWAEVRTQRIRYQRVARVIDGAAHPAKRSVSALETRRGLLRKVEAIHRLVEEMIQRGELRPYADIVNDEELVATLDVSEPSPVETGEE